MTDWETELPALRPGVTRGPWVLKAEAEAKLVAAEANDDHGLLEEADRINAIQVKRIAALEAQLKNAEHRATVYATQSDEFAERCHALEAEGRTFSERIADLELDKYNLATEVKRLTAILKTKTFIRSDQFKPSDNRKESDFGEPSSPLRIGWRSKPKNPETPKGDPPMSQICNMCINNPINGGKCKGGAKECKKRIEQARSERKAKLMMKLTTYKCPNCGAQVKNLDEHTVPVTPNRAYICRKSSGEVK